MMDKSEMLKQLLEAVMGSEQSIQPHTQLDLLKLIKNFEIENPDRITDFLKLSSRFSSFHEKIASLMDFAESHFVIIPSKQKSNALSEASRFKGNDYLIKFKDNKKALIYYNMAIGMAENSSDQLSMAYANRSAINFELGRFDDVIIDVNRALGGKYPENLKFKILLRKAKCFVNLCNYTAATLCFKETLESIDFLTVSAEKKTELKAHIEREMYKRIKIHIKNKKDVIKQDDDIGLELTDSPSQSIYCASEAVEVSSSPSKGRMIVATKDIQPGDVLAIEEAFASDLEEKSFFEFCYYCKKRCYSMVPCLKCTEVFYCNESCRQRSWDSEHNIECDIMPALNNLELTVVLRVFLKMTKKGRKLQKFIDKEEKYRGFNSPFPGFKDQKYCANNTSMMNLHYDPEFEHSKEICTLILYSCIFVSALKKTAFFDFVERESHIYLTVARMLTTIIFQIKANTFSLQPHRENIGSAIYPFMSLLNHSCDPNGIATCFQKDTFFLIAVEPIKKGQEICISYGPDFFMNEYERQLKFKYYRFKCDCKGCDENWGSIEEMPNRRLFKKRGGLNIIDRELKKFSRMNQFYFRKVKDVPGGKALLKQSDLDILFKMIAVLDSYMFKPDQRLYALKFLIINYIYDLIDINSLRLTKE